MSLRMERSGMFAKRSRRVAIAGFGIASLLFETLTRTFAMTVNIFVRLLIWVDGGFDGESCMQWVMNFCAQNKPRDLFCSKSVGLSNAMHGWLMGCCRWVRDYELLPQTSETFIYLAMLRIMVRRLA
ncbi:transposase [Nostoc carneum NIES-2107]|nr:transposase [Nostoc carneum NIES-2107]